MYEWIENKKQQMIKLKSEGNLSDSDATDDDNEDSDTD